VILFLLYSLKLLLTAVACRAFRGARAASGWPALCGLLFELFLNPRSSLGLAASARAEATTA
jgi:hypothetical protein